MDEGARQFFDEFLILPYRATNRDPYPFAWNDINVTEGLYSAALIRTLRLYERRFL